MDTGKNGIPEGLTTAGAQKLLEQYGRNELTPQKKESFFKKALCVMAEPMFLLLMVASVIYFILGEPRDGAVMLLFVTGMIPIDVAQEWKTDRTLRALKNLSAPRITVLRDGTRKEIVSTELVPGDIMVLCEGVKIPADGVILSSSDFCVDESSLTGEPIRVWKHARPSDTVPARAEEEGEGYWKKDFCYAGTLVIQGNALVLVEQTGTATEYGKAGSRVLQAEKVLTPLQKQTKSLVTVCAGIAALLFLLVSAFTYGNLSGYPFQERLIKSILSGVTLAMAMIPEEFPVVLTVFLSMGAWRLARKHSLVRRLPSVETLGAVSVLCVDKTGTITKNHMEVKELWPWKTDSDGLARLMGLACETEAYDPMEKAMLEFCDQSGFPKEALFSGILLKEYAFTSETRRMGHVWELEEKRIIAAKGSPEAVLSLCTISAEDRKTVEEKIEELSGRGLRVIAMASAELSPNEKIPESLEECSLVFSGLSGLYDPPREGIKEDIALCRKAGIRIVMITGDSGFTAAAIAAQTGIDCEGGSITGEMLDRMTDEELRQAVTSSSIFARVIPEHKMRIVQALKDNGEIAAMTGDGVNDAPALKYADIGIAMGKRGSEVSREAADLILMDDNFHTIVETVRDGRRIYDNIRKAVGYIFTIHIPIALASLVASVLGIVPQDLMFLPVHIVLMELMIDPTCSVILERQPAESCVMCRPPRKRSEKLITLSSLTKSVIQGLVLFAASFGSYYLMLRRGEAAPQARSMGLAIVILGNLFLVLVNSSECDSAWRSARKLARDRVMLLAAALTLLLLGASLYSPVHSFLKLAPLTGIRLLTAFFTSAASVFWYELVKAAGKQKHGRKQPV